MKKQDKEKVVLELKEKLSRAKSIYIADYTGLNVADITQLRRDFRQGGSEFKVVKNTLTRRAIEGTGFAEANEHLTGQIGLGIAYEESTVPAKVLQDFFKRIEKPKVRMFFVEGKPYSGEKLAEIASLPSRNELLAQVVRCVQAPLVNLVSTLDGMIRGLIYTIDGLKEKREKEAPAEQTSEDKQT